MNYINHTEFIPDNLESICVEIQKPKAKPILVITWYRPPNSNINILNDFEKLLQEISDKNVDLIITGDLNCDMIATNPTHHTKKLSDLINEYQLKQHIKSPTSITPTTKH
jgi:hypothetical protein